MASLESNSSCNRYRRHIRQELNKLGEAGNGLKRGRLPTTFSDASLTAMSPWPPPIGLIQTPTFVLLRLLSPLAPTRWPGRPMKNFGRVLSYLASDTA